MRIDTRQSGVMTLEDHRRAADQNVQSVFSEVLENFGREGYANAEPVSTETPLDSQIQQSWTNWYRVEQLGRYRGQEDAAALGESYAGVMSQAYDEGGYATPKDFLRGLPAEELETVQTIHRLADPIQVDSLSEEGALNLLVPPAAQVDLNRDGITQSGRANGIRFPDSTTSPEVTEAWNEATAGMSWGERAIYELRMKLPVLTANFVVNGEGQITGQREPGDPDWVNPMEDPEYSFVDETQRWIDYLDYFKNQIDPDQYAKDRSFFESFQQKLIEHDAP
ncbi:hypothetical protein [Rhodopirellula bahusiensis]|uniref:Uncharacterized protein n=1 Tax=Rhodopirellula bahusiensis TaxID=2014065 RepID=A0A2G1W457_9BACT|nr:hypothetical protein [Rhodopirellula bahusiensis]PHQ33803.1 hypothetical protein CEE69_17880 [Rhodopirellula bahusiensis]